MKFTTSKDSYNDPNGAKAHLEFLDSEDGQFFRQILFEAFRNRLGENREQTILDAACGPGWLTARLSEEFPNIEGLDGSKPFLEQARLRFPDLKFTEADLNGPLPYNDQSFDTIICSMAIHDVEDQSKTFAEFFRILKPSGKLMISITNPYYAFPVGIWKRGLLGKLLLRFPKLLVRPYHWFAKAERGYNFNTSVQSYFYKFSEHFNNLHDAGFKFEFIQELESLQDSQQYNLQYRLHRFPIILYLEFTKPA